MRQKFRHDNDIYVHIEIKMKFILTRLNIYEDSVNIFLTIGKCDILLMKYY